MWHYSCVCVCNSCMHNFPWIPKLFPNFYSLNSLCVYTHLIWYIFNYRLFGVLYKENHILFPIAKNLSWPLKSRDLCDGGKTPSPGDAKGDCIPAHTAVCSFMGTGILCLIQWQINFLLLWEATSPCFRRSECTNLENLGRGNQAHVVAFSSVIKSSEGQDLFSDI